MTNDQIAVKALDKDKWAVQGSVRHVLNILHNYIPHACFREAEEELFKAFSVNGVELTSSTMRREYEEWKKHTLDIDLLTNRQSVNSYFNEEKK